MGSVIIHIGLHKTATTYFQYNLFPSLKNTLYIHGSDFFKQWQEQQFKENKHILISYEGFSGLAWNEQGKQGKINNFRWIESFETNIQSLKFFFPNAVIVVMFRKQGDLLTSMYKQYVQEGGVLSLANFYGEGKVIQPDDLSFKTRIDILKDHFEETYFLNFEIYKKEKDEYLKTFYGEKFNMYFDKEKNKINQKDNISISGKKIELLRKINKYYEQLPRRLRSLIRYLKISPRDIFQRRLSFWKTKDSKELISLKQEINKKFVEDWSYFENKQWIHKK